MSATLCVDTYRKYFHVEEDAIFVGVKRFALTEYHLEDIAQMKMFPRMIQSRVNEVMKRLQNMRLATDVPKPAVESQTKLAVDVAKAVAIPGRSVLIFVAGIYEIGQIAEQFDECQGQFVLCGAGSLFSVGTYCIKREIPRSRTFTCHKDNTHVIVFTGMPVMHFHTCT